MSEGSEFHWFGVQKEKQRLPKGLSSNMKDTKLHTGAFVIVVVSFKLLLVIFV